MNGLKHFKFTAEPHGESHWMPIGRDESGDEVWCDGCCITDHTLAKRIAANMEAAYNQGLEVAVRSMIQYGIRILDGDRVSVRRGSISNTTTFGGYVVEDVSCSNTK